MAYFPFFADIEDRRFLIIGGGRIALQKVQALLPFAPDITVAAPEICLELQTVPGIRLLRTGWQESLADSAEIIIAATDDAALNHSIASFCRERHIPVNSVDCRPDCDFIFPALVKDGPLTIGISTAGASPSAAKYLKKQIRSSIPESFGDILEGLAALRPMVINTVPAADRAEAFRRLFEESLAAGRPLGDDEAKELLSSIF